MTPTSMYYQPENKAPFIGVLIFLAITIVTSLALGFAYAHLSILIPFIIIRVALPFAYGFGLGFVMHKGIKFGKIRGTKAQLGLAFIGSLIGLYIAWALWEAAIMEGAAFSMLGQPGSVWSMARVINMMGTWGLADSAVTGTFLWLFWIAEALIILFFAFTQCMDDSPFSEAGNNWAKATVMPAFEVVPQPALLKSALEEKNYDLLMTMPKGSTGRSHAQVTVYDCEGSPDYFLLVENMIMQANEKGEMETTAFDVVRNIRIEPEAAKAFLARRLEAA